MTFLTLGLFLSVCALLGVTVYVLLQNKAQQKRIDTLHEQLNIFVDTSIHVARCVDQLVRKDSPEPAHRAVASRRWLVAEAKQRLSAGTALDEVGLTLGLQKDELRLLAVAQGV